MTDQPGLFDDYSTQVRLADEARQAVWAWKMKQAGRPSQRVRILADLREAGGSGVCGTDWLQHRMPRYAAVIHALRQAGFDIDSQPCGCSPDCVNVARYTLLL